MINTMSENHTGTPPGEMMINKFTQCSLLVIGLTVTNAAYAHLPAYEGERVRHENHFTKEGFTSPVRGECDITAVGPTDDNAGSANIYLGGCPRIENLLRQSPFGQISRSFSLNSHHYSPQMIEKSDSKRLSLATAPILGQPPRSR